MHREEPCSLRTDVQEASTRWILKAMRYGERIHVTLQLNRLRNELQYALLLDSNAFQPLVSHGYVAGIELLSNETRLLDLGTKWAGCARHPPPPPIPALPPLAPSWPPCLLNPSPGLFFDGFPSQEKFRLRTEPETSLDILAPGKATFG